MSFSVYVIENPRGNIYIGYTENLSARLQRHNGALSTKLRSYTNINTGPWGLIYKEEFDTRLEAVSREKQLKSAKGREFLKKFRRTE